MCANPMGCFSFKRAYCGAKKETSPENIDTIWGRATAQCMICHVSLGDSLVHLISYNYSVILVMITLGVHSVSYYSLACVPASRQYLCFISVVNKRLKIVKITKLGVLVEFFMENFRS